jgi:hypothetical protein
MVGLGNVDNTTDVNKPISTATQTALNLKYDASNPNAYISGITSGNVTTALGYTPIKYLLRSTYALMIADGTPTVNTIYTVTNDENKGYNRSTYLWKTDGNREWIASTTDN